MKRIVKFVQPYQVTTRDGPYWVALVSGKRISGTYVDVMRQYTEGKKADQRRRSAEYRAKKEASL